MKHRKRRAYARAESVHSYIAVANIEECAMQTPLLGGSVVVPPHDVPGVGRVCAVADPTGAVANLMQPLKQ